MSHAAESIALQYAAAANATRNLRDWEGVIVNAESYPIKPPETDDTARLQRAFDDTPPGGTLMLDPKVVYRHTGFGGYKGITVNGNGALQIVNIFAKQKPAIWMSGTVETPKLITSFDATTTVTVAPVDGRTIIVPGASTLFSADDYVIVGDNYVTLSWAPQPPPPADPTLYTGRYELVEIDSVAGDKIVLAKAMEWPYDVAQGAFIQKVNMIDQPQIINNVFNEVDPGVSSSSVFSGPAESMKGHLTQLQYANGGGIFWNKVDGWQMHVANTHFCNGVKVMHNIARNPFRPEEGGHGYLFRDDNSNSTISMFNQGWGTRHTDDWSRSYDGLSAFNISHRPFAESFYTHGLGAKRITFYKNEVRDSTIITVPGFSIGDPGFNADYDCVIDSCTFNGQGMGIHVRVGSKNTIIKNCYVRSRDFWAVAVTRGAVGVRILNNTLINFNPSTNHWALYVDITTGTNTPIQYPSNILVRGNTFGMNGRVYIGALGDVTVEDNTWDVNIPADAGDGCCLRVLDVQAPTNLTIRRNTMKGVYERGVYGSIVVPTGGLYIIENNHVEGYTTAGTQLRSGTGAGNLRFIGNTYKGDSTKAHLFSSLLSDAILAGAVVRGNPALKTRDSGTVTLTATGLSFSYDVPHILMMSPSGFSWGVTPGNGNVGDAEIKAVTPLANKFTVSFKNNPANGQSLIFYYWCNVEN